MYVKTGYFSNKLKNLSLRIFNRIENNGNSRFKDNGEKVFIDNLFKHFGNSASSKKVIFDIGANVGSYSAMIIKKSEDQNIKVDLHLFEPTQSCFKEIEDKLSQDFVYANNFGISDHNEEAEIFYDKQKSGLASLYQRNLAASSIELNFSEKIQLKRLDEYIKQKNIEHIDFIKIDIEGHELKAFQGGGKYLNGEFIDFIQFEYGGANLDSRTSLLDLYSFLTERGFRLGKLLQNGVEIRAYNPSMENFAYSNYVAISNNIVTNLKR